MTLIGVGPGSVPDYECSLERGHVRVTDSSSSPSPLVFDSVILDNRLTFF